MSYWLLRRTLKARHEKYYMTLQEIIEIEELVKWERRDDGYATMEIRNVEIVKWAENMLKKRNLHRGGVKVKIKFVDGNTTTMEREPKWKKQLYK